MSTLVAQQSGLSLPSVGNDLSGYFSRIADIPVLTAEEERELAERRSQRSRCCSSVDLGAIEIRGAHRTRLQRLRLTAGRFGPRR